VTDLPTSDSNFASSFEWVDGGRVFDTGCTANSTTKHHIHFYMTVKARYIRIMPYSWVAHSSMQVGFLVGPDLRHYYCLPSGATLGVGPNKFTSVPTLNAEIGNHQCTLTVTLTNYSAVSKVIKFDCFITKCIMTGFSLPVGA